MDTDGNGLISKAELVAFWERWYTEKGPGSKLKKPRNSPIKNPKQ